MECHIPRLYDIPQGSWSCCECTAGTYKRKQRCGVCKQCLRLNCGECVPCKGKKQFGGDGTYGSSCKLRKCNFMRFAPPESVPTAGRCSPSAKGGSTMLLSKAKKRSPFDVSSVKGFASSKNGEDIVRSMASSKATKNDASKSRSLGEYPYLSPMKESPGLGWTPKRVNETGQIRYYWISPIRKIEFKRHTAACKFEKLRRDFGSDEVEAWEEYRKRGYARGKFRLSVVSPQNYDRHLEIFQKKTIKSMSVGRHLSPGIGWTQKRVYESKHIVTHWVSPIRHIEFRRYTAACKFEWLRRKFRSDEFKAWEVFRKCYYYTKKGGHPSFVVSPQDYDAQSNNDPAKKRWVGLEGQLDSMVENDSAVYNDVEGDSSGDDDSCCVCNDGGGKYSTIRNALYHED